MRDKGLSSGSIQVFLGPPSASRPMTAITLSYIIGLILTTYFDIPYILLTIAALTLPILTAIAVLTGRLQAKTKSVWRLLLALAMLSGALRMQTQIESWALLQGRVQSIAQSGEMLITGTVQESNRYEPNSQTLVLKQVFVEKWGRSQPFPCDLIVRTGHLPQDAHIGDHVQFTGRIAPIRGLRVQTGFDFQQYRYAQNVFAESYVSSDDVTINTQNEFTLRTAAFRAQDQINTHLLADESSNEQRALISGLLSSIALGIRSGVPASLNDSLHASGLAHITSISGLHVSLVLFGFAFALKLLGLRRRWAGGLTVVVAILYLCLVGFRVPTVRAALMAFVLIGSYFTERRVDALNSLGLAALLILLYNPSELWLPSFQLSFTAVLALVLFNPMQQWLFHAFPFGFKHLAEGMFASVVVISALAPFSLHTFHDITPAAVLGNLIAIPLLGILLPLTYIWLAVSWLPFGLLTSSIGWALVQVCRALLWTIQTTAADGAFQFTLAFPGVACLAVGLLALLLLARPLVDWGRIGPCRVLNLHIALVLALASLLLYGQRLAPGNLRVDFVALGQGDCTLIRTPNDKTILIDGGPKPFHQTSRTITQLEEFLLAQGVSAIDLLILTHPQNDHIGVLPQVAQRFPVGRMLEGVADNNSMTYQNLVRALDERGVERHPIRQGDSFQIDGVEFWALNPALESHEKDINEQSVVLWMRWKKFDALFTGDIGSKTEQRLITDYDNWDADILKVAHHGSRYSTSDGFLRETLPEFAIIQTGRNNYGHPHIDTRQRLYDINAHILRTDYDGSIQLQTDGEGYRLYASRSNRLYVFKEE
ncbi:MAG: DNA internalization-related competence protein ComEC/Rec2 [Candidatus Hinthialibacter antarcticus]|nr:DNA internalization-related competence protein ComEC/Rec2 [Candidatus Hinthialibacter antarcticus]